jgi:hypothetical protein
MTKFLAATFCCSGRGGLKCYKLKKRRFMKTIMITIVLLFSSLTWANEDCIVITNEKLCIELEWIEGPFLGAYSKNIVKFKDLNVSDDQIQVYRSPSENVQFFGWMIMHGHQHGTRPLSTQVLEEGIYENSKIFYMGGMMGTWQFKVKIGNEEFVLHALDV